ncbi:FIST N-terminal domain-containing protein [Paracoccus sp. p4-l81]|uniref:FIST N-terminal domain-containing protein n=1 Tax=unclassified Paracoccus (in: a-proteobacteria) TaxID=2688777 RepID=UPI0035B814DB
MADQAIDSAPVCAEGRAPLSASVPAGDAELAARQIAARIGADPAFVLLFASPHDAVLNVARALRPLLPQDCRILGCSSAGEVGAAGYCSGTVTAIAFPASIFAGAVSVLRDVDRLPVSDWMAEIRSLRETCCRTPGRSVFGLLLADGLSGQEEVVVATLDAALPGMPIIGGSAGDGLDFTRTLLVLDDQGFNNAAIFGLFETDLDLHEIVFAHFRPTATRMVVTDARPEDRLMLELNAEPAAQEYARLVGVPVADLSPRVFARHPLMVRMGGRHYVRAISEVTRDDGLKLMSAIEPGSVLTLGLAEDLTEGLQAQLDALPAPPCLVLTFDCILRRIAVEQLGLGPQIGALAARYRLAGFNTYGEQHGGMHVNQTLVGLAFLPQGSSRAAE